MTHDWIYFVKHRSSKAIKIGFSAFPLRRAKGLSAQLIGCLPGDREFEATLHGRFARHRITGEWFKDCAPIRNFIRGTKATDNIQRLRPFNSQIAIYPDDALRKLIEEEAHSQNRKLGPTVLQIVREYFNNKKKKEK